MEDEKVKYVKINYEEYLKIYEQIVELRTIKNFIKHNVEKNENENLKIDYYFGEHLLNLIKYIDTEFYNELQQG